MAALAAPVLFLLPGLVILALLPRQDRQALAPDEGLFLAAALSVMASAWLGLALAVLALCGMASYYAHVNFEDSGEESGSGDASISSYEANKTGMPIRV